MYSIRATVPDMATGGRFDVALERSIRHSAHKTEQTASACIVYARTQDKMALTYLLNPCHCA